MTNLTDISDESCLRRYIRDKGRCMNIRTQVFLLIWPSKKNYLQNPRRGKWVYPSATEAQTRCKMTHWNLN